MPNPLIIVHADEWILAGWHGAGNRPRAEKRDAGVRHAVNEALKLRPRPDLIVVGDLAERAEEAAEIAAAALHAADFQVLRAAGRAADGIYTYCADLPEDEPVRVIGQTAVLGQLRRLGCEAEGEALEISALRELPGVGPKTAEAILADGDPLELFCRPEWMPRCRSAEKVRLGLTIEAYTQALETLRLRRVELRVVDGPRGASALRQLGLGALADRIEEAEYAGS